MRPTPPRSPRRVRGVGGSLDQLRVAPQYQEDLPVVQPIVWRFDVAVGQCTHCGRRVQGRHPLQTSDAVGAANVHLGPSAVALVSLLHKEVGMPLGKIAALLRERFGLTVTPGGLVHVLHRAARVAAPTYTALCEQIRGSPVVSPEPYATACGDPSPRAAGAGARTCAPWPAALRHSMDQDKHHRPARPPSVSPPISIASSRPCSPFCGPPAWTA